MSRIHILDEETVSHIAAGEVVERAASIVKELAENAIDAGASKITIDLSADKSAVTRIVIADNGCGMGFDDALLAFRQHATSKIASQKDLEDISTLGFRGEALASIAAVSKVTLVSKERDSASPEAVKLVIEGGEVKLHTAAGAPDGTTITIEDMFFNTPARKKFQKSVSTELSHVYDIVERIALAHTDVAFVMTYQGKERLRTFGNGNLSDVIGGVFGPSFAKDLVPVKGEFGIAKVSGLVTKPGCDMKSTPTRFYLSINGRQIVSRSLQWAVREGYGTLLPKGMYPAAFLNIELDPAVVDVNVHPTKREIRLSRERDVMISVQDTVYSSLHEERIFQEASAPVKSVEQPKLPSLDDFVKESVIAFTPSAPKAGGAFSAKRTERQLRRTESAASKPEIPIPEIMGQIGGTYIIAKDAAGNLLLIDQHAAHERIMYDRLLARQGTEARGQELIVPKEITLSRREAAAMPDMKDILAAAGYVLEPFGADTWSIRSVPVVSDRLGDPEVIHEILAQALDGLTSDRENVLDRVLKTAACRAVVKGNTELNLEQMQRLLRQLYATTSPYTCPHGRPTVIVLGKDKLEKMFLRT
ncbi:MAG TPA: DNA mismatch repair endonuclease MutL [Methanocorpusculum sp.]|nr:DNA mismatch repair endonuclease MutL [Methanocorpusculum sp.]